MKIKIPLPDMDTALQTGAHPYPLQIAKQTETFISASVWHVAFLDTAAGQYIRLPWGLWRVRRMFKVTDSAWNRGIQSFFTYRQVFEKSVMQTIVVSLKSQWDWFVSRIGEFILFAYQSESSDPLPPKRLTDLRTIGQNKPIERQIDILSHLTGIDFVFTQSIKDAIQELTLVRNLGIHNRWEVDEKYLERSVNASNWDLGELRIVGVDEVELWQVSTITLVRNVAFPIAFKYGSIPGYPEYKLATNESLPTVSLKK